MIDNLNTPFVTQPTEIKITPVSNVWVVKIPLSSNSMKKQFEEMMRTMASSMRQGVEFDELEQLIKDAGIPIDQDVEKMIQRDESVHVFEKFHEVLAFLQSRITE